VNGRNIPVFPRFFFFAILLLTGLSACGIEPFLSPLVLQAPFNLEVFPGNGSLTVRFESVNTEDSFDGFDVHLAESSGVRTAEVLPLLNSGTSPTIPSSRYLIAGGAVIEHTFTFDRDNNTLQNGTTYYVAVRSRSFEGRYSEFSGEVSTTLRPESVTPVVLADSEGYSLLNGNTSAPWDVSCAVVTNACWLSSPTGTILDAGAFLSGREYNKVTNASFPSPGTPVQALAGHVYVIKRSDNRYGKVYVRSVSLTDVTFDWAFQPSAGNTDI
jgi:hypothetical protein